MGWHRESEQDWGNDSMEHLPISIAPRVVYAPNGRRDSTATAADSSESSSSGQCHQTSTPSHDPKPSRELIRVLNERLDHWFAEDPRREIPAPADLDMLSEGLTELHRSERRLVILRLACRRLSNAR